MLSQNGWPANKDPDAIGVVAFTVAGVTFPNGVKGGDVETVLRYVAEQFHRTVEPLKSGWCWGYFYKVIEGSSKISNHASGTAVDVNAPAHPMGKRGTFSSSKVAAIRVILDYCEGVVRWGGDYTSRADEMHFEINASPTAVSVLANKIRNANTPPVDMAEWMVRIIMELPNLHSGWGGEHVQTWQGVLKARGYSTVQDGEYGPATTRDTKALQAKYGLPATGTVDPATWKVGLLMRR